MFFSSYLYILVGIQNGPFSCYLGIFKLILEGLGFPIWENPSMKDSKIVTYSMHTYVCGMYLLKGSTWAFSRRSGGRCI